MHRFAGNSSSCQVHAFTFGHPLQPIVNLSFVCFIPENFIPNQILCSNITSCNFIWYNAKLQKGFINCGSFIVYILLLGTRKAFTLTVFPPSAGSVRLHRSSGHPMIYDCKLNSDGTALYLMPLTCIVIWNKWKG